MRVFRTVSGILGVVLTVSCTPYQKEKHLDGSSIRVQVPMPNPDEGYSLQIIELKTIQDLPNLKGSSARFLIDPASNKKSLLGRNPNLRYFRDQEGVIVPTDDLSLQLLTVYAHFEKLREFDQALGLDVLQYPRVVAVNTQMKSAGDANRKENNALFSSEFDAFLMAPFNLESLPLMANGGVIAHEHFHSLFQKLFIEPLKEKYPSFSNGSGSPHDARKLALAMGLIPDFNVLPEAGGKPIVIDRRMTFENHDIIHNPKVIGPTSRSRLSPLQRKIFHSVLLRGVNEGLADVWGWVYSGDMSFVQKSLPEQWSRDLKNSPGGIDDHSEFITLLTQRSSEVSPSFYVEAFSNQYAYSYGTQLARSIANLALSQARRKQIDVQKLRPEIGKMLIVAVQDLKKDFETLGESDLYSLSRAIRIVVTHMPGLSSKDCNFVFGTSREGDLEGQKLRSECKKAGTDKAADKGEDSASDEGVE